MGTSSDFSASAVRPPGGAAWGAGAALLATLTLGFTEGCLEVERRPIPLRFALRYAAYNLLPSAVWSSVPASLVAKASRVPVTSLVSSQAVGEARTAELRAAWAKRLLALRSVRALRHVAGSYGLAWGLWRLHSSSTAPAEAEKRAPDRPESVVRLAPVNSPLSRASRHVHGSDHVVPVSVPRESWRQSSRHVATGVDWTATGINTRPGDVEGQIERLNTADRCLVMEVELADAATATYAAKLSSRATRATHGSPLCSVAVLSPSGEPLDATTTAGFDVCFNPMSAVLTFVATVCQARGLSHIELYAQNESKKSELETDSLLHVSAAQLAAGLLHRHGITSTILAVPQPPEDNDEAAGVQPRGKTTGSDLDDVPTLFILAESPRDARGAAERLCQQGVAAQDACFIVEESLVASSQRPPVSPQLQFQSALLSAATAASIAAEDDQADAVDHQDECTYLSVADISDQTLQAVRELLRLGQTPGAIQAAIYAAFGPQRCPTAPADRFSHIDRYI